VPSDLILNEQSAGNGDCETPTELLQQTKYIPRRQLGFEEPTTSVSPTYTSLSKSHASTVNMFASALKPASPSMQQSATETPISSTDEPSIEPPASLGSTYQQLSTRYPSTIAMFGSTLPQGAEGERLPSGLVHCR